MHGYHLKSPNPDKVWTLLASSLPSGLMPFLPSFLSDAPCSLLQVLEQLLHIKAYLRGRQLLEQVGYMCYFIVPRFTGEAAANLQAAAGGVSGDTGGPLPAQPPPQQEAAAAAPEPVRKRLVLQPRSAAAGSVSGAAAASSHPGGGGHPSPFGSAKPVDTAAKDRQMEEKVEVKAKQAEDEWRQSEAQGVKKVEEKLSAWKIDNA